MNLQIDSFFVNDTTTTETYTARHTLSHHEARPIDLCDDPEGRVRGAPGAFGLREVHHAELHRGTPGFHRRQHLARRHADRPPAARAARLRHGLPELCALPAYERPEEHRLRARHAGGRKGRGPATGGRGRGAVSAAGPGGGGG